jgi:mannose-6-phosphate isomerase-like protein (cupin superfamily)
MKVSLKSVFDQIPGRITEKWPEGEPFASVLGHGTMSVEVFAPRGHDAQEPHTQDELYFVVSGRAEFFHEAEHYSVSAGDVMFVPAYDRHHFEAISNDFVTWVVFWGPTGGER